MTCEAKSHPEATTTWRKDGRNFYGDSNRVSVTRTMIRFKTLVLADSGRYECYAENTIGSDKKSMSLVVEPGKCFEVCHTFSRYLGFAFIIIAVLNSQFPLDATTMNFIYQKEAHHTPSVEQFLYVYIANNIQYAFWECLIFWWRQSLLQTFKFARFVCKLFITSSMTYGK